MSKLEVDAIEPQSGTTLTLGASGDAVNIASGASITNFKSTGINDSATANAITIGSDETVTIVKDLIVDTNTLFVDASENTVVIGGTDATSWNTNADELVVAGASAGGMTFYNPTQSNIFFADGTTGTDVSKGRIQYVHSGDSLLFGTGATERMRIDGSGNVGIGTSSPSNLLHLEASNVTMRLEDTDASGYSLISTTGTSDLQFKADDGNNDASTKITFDVDGSERMRITSGGGVNVGSGVLSSASGDGNIVVDQGIYIGTFNGDNQIRSSSAGAGSATLYIGNAAIQVSSDRRLKTNIADTTMSAVDKIKQVRIVDFNWNDPSDTSYNNRNARGTWTGVIAQELIDVFPFAVNAPRNEEDLSIDTESEKKWQVDQAHLVPVLMKAIQEQQTKIEQLEARITALENK